MNKVYLSDAGPKVSPAIYGFWRWEAGKGDMEKIVNLCLELGVNTFDHADRYGNYTCEKRFGEVLAKQSFKRSDIVLFSKCGVNTPPLYRVNHVNTSSEHITLSVENSLRNLQTDYLDVFLLDQLDPLSDLESTALALEKLKSSGKVKNIGVSNFSVYQHQLLVSYLNIPVVSNHIDLNLLNTAALDNGAIDYIKQKYMRPLATSPIQYIYCYSERAYGLRVYRFGMCYFLSSCYLWESKFKCKAHKKSPGISRALINLVSTKSASSRGTIHTNLRDLN